MIKLTNILKENHISPRDINDEYYNRFLQSIGLLVNDLIDKGFNDKDIVDFLRIEMNRGMLKNGIKNKFI